MEEEIDLREYIAVLIKYWRWIVGLSLLAAIAAFIAVSFVTPKYEAEARILILQSKTDITFEPKFQTEIDGLTNVRNDQQTLVSLVSNSDVAALVLQVSGDLLASEKKTVSDLLKKVDATNEGDLISIKVRDKDAEVAARLANVWANSYESYVNKLYSDQKQSLLTEVEKQALDMEQTYRAVQQAWEQFVNDNHIATLEQEVEIKKTRVRELRQQNTLIEEMPLTTFSLEQSTRQATLSRKYQTLDQLDAWQEDALTLRDQLNNSTASSAGDAGVMLAFVLLQSEVLANSASSPASSSTSVSSESTSETTSTTDVRLMNSDSPVHLQLDAANVAENSVSAGDVDKLLNVIETRKGRIETDIEALTAALQSADFDQAVKPSSGNLPQLVAQLDTEILTLEAELEAQQAQQRELKQDRDLAWDNYVTVQRKVSEVKLASNITDSQVRLASSAIPPQKPVSPRRLMSTAVAGALGLMFSVFGVFVIEFWRNWQAEEA